MTEYVVPWWGLAPFVAMLLCVAVLPLLAQLAGWWERPRHQLLVSLTLGVPVAVWMGSAFGGLIVAEALWEYVSFIVLLAALFTVSGGIFLDGDLRASPRNNTLLLALGGGIASIIGTTGASMLLIRPLLNANSERRRVVHTVVFFIFIVSNCGGLLTPLGDPPLFLGMLRGVPFTWTLTLFPHWLFVNALLLLTYYALDRRRYATESAPDLARDEAEATPLRVHGKLSLLYLLVIVVAVALLPSLDLEALAAGHAGLAHALPWREAVMVAAAALSYLTGDRRARFEGNQFTWTPILEVAAIFVGIFLTMIPALRFLHHVAPSLPLTASTFFLATGGLSAVLDNAPTYATFFEIARGLPPGPGVELVAGVPADYLTAISLGAVFFGAMTYIGNGPNFMVKSVAEHAGVEMPHFGAYVGWAVRYLLPVLLALLGLFIADALWLRIGGGLLVVVLLARVVWWGRARPIE